MAGKTRWCEATLKRNDVIVLCARARSLACTLLGPLRCGVVLVHHTKHKQATLTHLLDPAVCEVDTSEDDDGQAHRQRRYHTDDGHLGQRIDLLRHGERQAEAEGDDGHHHGSQQELVAVAERAERGRGVPVTT